MIFSRFFKTPFARALEDYGLERCSLTGEDLWIGLGPDPEYRRAPVRSMPRPSKSLLFVAAPDADQAGLIDALTKSREAGEVTSMLIGTSHDYANGRPKSLDMSATVSRLANGHFPALEKLSLGDMEQLYNGHRGFGRIGDITGIFHAAPNLRDLSLHGQFSMSRSVRHDTLTDFSAWLDDVGVSGGPVSQQTISHLLSSSFPRLKEADLDLEEGDRETDYVIPDAFFEGGMPALTGFGMNCLAPGSAQRLAEWKAGRKII